MAQFCLILFGPPGSGKGTQAALLRDRLGLAHISTGEMLRARVAAGDALGKQAAGFMNSGGLVPDEMVNRIVEDRIQHPDSTRGFILDGYPRTVEQAKLLSRMLQAREIRSAVVHLEVGYNEIVARLSARRQCAVCGSLSKDSTGNTTGESCGKCGAKMTLRDDDRPEVIQQRMQAYESQTRPVLDYFRGAGVAIFEVQAGSRTPEAIAAEIERVVEAELGTANVRTA